MCIHTHTHTHTHTLWGKIIRASLRKFLFLPVLKSLMESE